MAEPMEPLGKPERKPWWRNVFVLIVVGVVAAGVLALFVDDDPRRTAGQRAVADRCAQQWDRAKAETDSLTGDDAELRRTFSACPDVSTWRREHDRTGHGRWDLTLRAGCAVLGSASSPVCDDARERGMVP